MKAPYTIRFAIKADIGQLIDLCEAHAQYEKSEYNRAGKAENLLKSLFNKTPKLYCLVVECENRLIGYATYMVQYSTWDACEYVYMDCLFLDQSTRGRGIGEKIMLTIKEEAQKQNCQHIQWQTPDFNEGAIRFYKRIGAFSKGKERFFWEV